MKIKNEDCVQRIHDMEQEILKKFLYEAIFQPDIKNPIPFSATEQPELRKYIDGFGQQKGDYALGAFYEEQIVGLVWTRLVKGYGYIGSNTPELNISVLSPYRGKNIGSLLLSKMLILLKEKGFEKVSLSVQKANKALKLYEKLGFEIFSADDATYTMICFL